MRLLRTLGDCTPKFAFQSSNSKVALETQKPNHRSVKTRTETPEMPSPKKTTTQLTGSKSHPETAQKPPPTTSARQVSTCSTWPNSDLGSHLNRVVKRTAHFSTSKLPFRCYRHQCSNISVVMSFQKWHRASPALPARKRSSTSLFSPSFGIHHLRLRRLESSWRTRAWMIPLTIFRDGLMSSL